MTGSSYIVRDLDGDVSAAFSQRGHRRRHVFPHRIIRLPKGGPDGYKLSSRMCGPIRPDEMWELALYALPPALDGIPASLFFDDDIVWHQQQFGLPGLIATANLVVRPRNVYAMVLVADVVARIGRRRSLKTHIESRFAGWSRLLVNAALDFALDAGAERLMVATAAAAHHHTDPARSPELAFFERIYDHSVDAPFVAHRDGNWWVMNVAANAAALVRPQVRTLPLDDERIIAVCHDIERGWGHRGVEPAFAAVAERAAPVNLDQMLAVEANIGVDATYNVVGAFLGEIRPALERDGHALGFHSFDHSDVGDQLGLCRGVDYRIKGYRPPQSRLEAISAEDLAFHNFEWLASSHHSLGANEPELGDAIARIPITLDDFELHQGIAYDDWEEVALRELASRPVGVVSLHDCYADLWLPYYAELLAKLQDLGSLRTLDEVANRVWLAHAV